MLQELLWQVASGEIDIVDRILAQLYQGVEMSCMEVVKCRECLAVSNFLDTCSKAM